ncbi:hypothetical protein Hanom_Chr14g01271541 [Helianthus anomalus]
MALKIPYAITSKVGGTLVAISPSTISTTFGLNDLAGKTSFEKRELHQEFIETGYEGQLKGVTIYNTSFPTLVKLFFHTLLTCLSAKTTTFNEIPLNIHYLGYAILTNSDFNYSQALFYDLVINVNNVKKAENNENNNAFLMYPRLLSYHMQKHVSKTDFEQGAAFKINSLTSEAFTRLMAKESAVSKTQEKKDENVLDESTSDAQTSIVEPTAPGDMKPAKTKKKPVKTKKPTKTNKAGHLKDEIPEVNPMATQMSLETTAATSSQHVERSQPIDQTPHESSQKDNYFEEATPFEFYETLGGNSCGAAPTTVKSTDLQLDSGFITKTPLKATSVEATTVTSVPVGSPQYQEKGAFVANDMESSPIIKTNTTTSGGNSNDPIKLGDELRYKDLTERMSSVENSIGEMKKMLGNSKSQPSHQQITQELWNSMQPILDVQRELAELNHNKHMELIRIMVVARYKDTQADIWGIKESLVKLNGSSLAPVFEKDDER